MNHASEVTPQQPQYIATADGCHVGTAAIYLGKTGAVELLEWAPDDLVPQSVTFAEAQELAAKSDFSGGGWQVASPHEWTGEFNYEKEDPASDLPGLKPEIYWTRQKDPSSSVVAFAVLASLGNVNWNLRDNRFRVRFSRRVAASQFLALGR